LLIPIETAVTMHSCVRNYRDRPVTPGYIPRHDRQMELPVKKSWYKKPYLAESTAEVLQNRYDLIFKNIMETIRPLITRTGSFYRQQ
jgi:hypothetical protein